MPFYVEGDKHTAQDDLDPIPVLSDEWLTAGEIEARNALSRQSRVNNSRLSHEPEPNTAISETPVQDER